MAKSNVEKIQTILGVEPDGIWGPKSQGALNAQIGATGGGGNPKLKKIQTLLAVEADGFWGSKSQKALNNELGGGSGGGGSVGGIKAKASSFADPADVQAFKACKATGKTDLQCFAVGDNGIGKFGADTAQTKTPMVAVHPSDAIAKWGSMLGAAHRPVRVTVGSRKVIAFVEDQLGKAGRIDLNPAAAKELGLKPPFLVDCVWEWL
ncbi:MAG TPA: hypothetical protein VEX43_19420 [Chthoniobacterales bacterium]|nr:hypothetical protein [Chthoniobacterales bacterium]